MAKTPKSARRGGLPTKDEIVEYLASAPEKTGKRELARAFGVKGADRIALKRLLAEMTDEGTLTGNRKRLKEKGALAATAVILVTATDSGGDLIGRPASWTEDGPPPRVRILEAKGRRGEELTLAAGDRVLARLERLPEEDEGGIAYIAEPIRKLAKERHRLLGIFRKNARGGGTIQPIDRRDLKEWPVEPHDKGEAQDGDLVRFEISTPHHRSRARIDEVVGNPSDQRQISLIAVHAHGLPEEFSKAALEESERLEPFSEAGRTDLRGIPLLTIDPADARDHDDAVHAEPDPKHQGGFIVTVAIADVAHYVRTGTRLDREAETRGNSIYFPDRVVPMLPERISNDLCSLREGEDRPCLAVRMSFDARGEKRSHVFSRAVMRSAAKLSYEQAQAAIDGRADGKTKPLLDVALRPLWRAYAKLAEARERRSPLDLDLPERKILLNEKGLVERVVVPERLAAHRLIEEMMIQANVAAAETLESKRGPVVYRVHTEPSKEKLLALSDFLASLDLRLPKSGMLRPSHFNDILARAKGKAYAELVNEVVLRSQAQAEYNVQNAGHFGLNLRRYAHFTSPIRRYADLMVHRALISALGLGGDGLDATTSIRLGAIAQAISLAERRAMAAERETADRLIAAFLADRVGASFPARVSGVSRSGLFVRLRETGADGFVPASTIGAEFYFYDEARHALVGERTGETYRLGDSCEVRLIEAIPTAGALRFEMLSPGVEGAIPGRASRHKRMGLRQRGRRRH